MTVYCHAAGRVAARNVACPVHVEASLLRAVRISRQYHGSPSASQSAFSRALRSSHTSPHHANDILLSHLAGVAACTALSRRATSTDAVKHTTRGHDRAEKVVDNADPERGAGDHDSSVRPESLKATEQTGNSVGRRGNPEDHLASELADLVAEAQETRHPHRLEASKRKKAAGKSYRMHSIMKYRSARERFDLIPAPTWNSLFARLSGMSTPLAVPGQQSMNFTGRCALVQKIFDDIKQQEYSIAGYKEMRIDKHTTEDDRATLLVIGRPLYTALARNTILRHLQPSKPPPRHPDQVDPGALFQPNLSGYVAPHVWTQTTFLETIVKAVQTRPPRLSRYGQGYMEETGQLILYLFNHVLREHEVASEPAYNEAIRFLLESRRLGDAQHLLNTMEQHGLKATTETMNVFLGNCAAVRHFRAFQRYLVLMEQQQISPDGQTWLALLQLQPEPENREKVLKQLATLGYLDLTSTIQMVIPELLQSAESTGDVAQAMEDHIKDLDETVGPSWVNSESVAALIREFCERGLLADALTVLSNLQSARGIKISRDHLHALLSSCQKLRLMDTASIIVEAATTNWKLNMPDRISLQILWKTASDCRMFNAAKVIWKYLMMTGHARDQTMRFVFRSLLESFKDEESVTDQDSATVRSRWRARAGRVMVGREDIVQGMAGSTAFEVASKLMDAERELFGKKQPEKPFWHDLKHGIRIDKKWRETQQQHLPGDMLASLAFQVSTTDVDDGSRWYGDGQP